MNETVVRNGNVQHCAIKCMSWTAVIVGALVAIGLAFLLHLFTASISLTAFSTSPEGNTTVAVGSYLGLVIGNVAIMFVAGLIAGHLARPFCSLQNHGELYGFVTWCLALVFGILLVTQLDGFIDHARGALNPNITINVDEGARNLPGAVENLRHPQERAPQARPTVSTEKAASNLGLVGFATFILFFIGALAACAGGRVGMRCKRLNDEHCGTHHH